MTGLQSDAVRISRVICIFFMSYVHLHFFILPGADFPILKPLLVQTLGRSSVPLLSAVSGFLIVGYFDKRGYLSAIQGRFRTLIVPMACWNLVAIATLGSQDFLNDIFALTHISKYEHLTFLRDIFALALVTPVLIYLSRKVPTLLLVASTAYFLADWSNLFVLRPQIAFFYTIGILLRERPQAPHPALSILALALFAWVAGLEIQRHPIIEWKYFEHLSRLVAALTFWNAALILAEGANWLKKLDRAAFPYFLSHVFLFQAVGSLLAHSPVSHNILVYKTTWVITPLVCYLGVYIFLMRLPILIGWLRLKSLPDGS
jgi:hypothetical protein